METRIKPRDAGNFAEGSVRSNILRLALPMTVAQLINLLYSVVDRAFLARMPGAGTTALTSVGLVLPIISILLSVASLCGTGGAPLFSISRGRGDDTEAGKILGNAFCLLLIFGAALTAAVVLFMKPILYAFGASEDTYPYGAEYLTVYTAGTIFVMISLGMNSFINAQGAAKRGTLTIAIGAAINIVLDPIFIFVLGLGVTGAALATVIAQLASATWVMLYLCRGAAIRLRLSNMRLKASRVGKIITLGLSGFCMQLTNSLIQIVCNRTLRAYGGDLYIGVMTVINAVREIVFMPVSGVAAGATPVLGFNFGAKQYARVKEAIRFSAKVTVIYTICIWAAILAAPYIFMRIFTNDTALIAAGMRAMRLYFACGVFMSLQMSSQQVFVALGKSKQAVFFSLLRKVFLSAPLTIALPYLGMGTDGVFLADTISQLLGGLLCGGTMFFTLYKKLDKNASES
ncbi:MAG: MATE family efflux transporter [Oscillospiraceae bacterium]|jgi:putative MATE family efflux protein|nr:MATE family efflux transporter [Oscillospiraceae bacterium]